MKRETMRGYAIGVLFAFGGAIALGSGTVWAESACKGMPQNACEKAANCIWVGGYEKKDGKRVAGYCRTKSTGGTTAKKDDKTASSTPKDKTKSKQKADDNTKSTDKTK